MKRLALVAGGICISTMSIFGEVNVGDIYKINLPDVDGNTHATADGRITILVLTNQANTDKAHTLADRVPDFCLGDPTSYRMITVVVLEKKHSRPVRAIFSAVILGCLFGFAPTAIDLLGTPRLRWLRLSRRADDCRLPPLRFECLAKIVRLRILTKDVRPSARQ